MEYLKDLGLGSILHRKHFVLSFTSFYSLQV